MAVYPQAAVATDTEDPKVSRTHFLLLLLLSSSSFSSLFMNMINSF